MAGQVPFCEPCAMGYSCPEHDPRAETIGELADRLPDDQWVDLPEYGVRVKKWGEPAG